MAASRRERTLTSISKSGSRNAVLNSEQKWAMAGTSHQDWTSSTETGHPWDILGSLKVCNDPSSHRKVASSVTRNSSGTLQTRRKLSLPSCWSGCHCDQRSAMICFNQCLNGAEQMEWTVPFRLQQGGSTSQLQLINYF